MIYSNTSEAALAALERARTGNFGLDEEITRTEEDYDETDDSGRG